MALVAQGDSERAAINYIADSKVFLHRERMAWQRPAGRARQHARRTALWQKYQRLRRDARSTPDPLARTLGSPGAITKCGWHASTTRHLSVVTKASDERSAFESHRPAESHESPLASR